MKPSAIRVTGVREAQSGIAGSRITAFGLHPGYAGSRREGNTENRHPSECWDPFCAWCGGAKIKVDDQRFALLETASSIRWDDDLALDLRRLNCLFPLRDVAGWSL